MKTKTPPITNKSKFFFLIIFLILSLMFFDYGIYFLKIDFSQVFKIIFQHIFSSEDSLHYGDVGLGTLMLINSLVGLGIVMTFYAGAINLLQKKKIKLIILFSFLWASFISFSYSIIFSSAKLLAYMPKNNSTYVNQLGNLSFICFVVGIFFLIFSFIFFVLKINPPKTP